MPRTRSTEDSWDDSDDDFDGDLRDDDAETTVACPYCGRQIYEGALQCPGCGNSISEEDAPPARKPWWFIIAALLCLYAVYRWVIP